METNKHGLGGTWSGSRLEHALREAEASLAIRILLDLEELTFIDAAGLGSLVAAWHRSMSDNNRLQVTPGRGNVADMFRLTALDMGAAVDHQCGVRAHRVMVTTAPGGTRAASQLTL